MSLQEDLSSRALVLTADPALWRDLARRALQMASLVDGRSLEPERVDSSDDVLLASEEVLDILEHGALLVVDLVDLEPHVFSLVAWHARSRTGSTLLLRRGAKPLPFELHEFPVRSCQGDTPEEQRLRIAEMATRAAHARGRRLARGRSYTSPADNLAMRRRREKSGVRDALLLADRDVLEGSLDGALNAMRGALAAEHDAPDLLVRLAVLQRMAGRWPEAARTLERAVRSDKESAPAWRELGIARDKSGLPGSEDALRRAIDIDGDYEASVALALWLMQHGRRDEAAPLLESAMERTGWQLNLVLPTLGLRVGLERRVHLTPQEKTRVEQVRAIRGKQARADPPEDAPWSAFDAARSCVHLGHVDEALELLRGARQHLTAPWQTTTFGSFLDDFEAAGVEVQPMRDALGIEARGPKDETSPTPKALRPFHAAVRDLDWYVQNVPCMAACPVGTDAGAYVHLLAQRRFEDAFRVARGPNPFASVCGRVCAAPCEDACRRGKIDDAVEIRSLKRFLTERSGVESDVPLVEEVLEGDAPPCIEGDAYVSHLRKLGGGSTQGKEVVVVGGGPAGLACAHDLTVLGYRVTLYEATETLGGMMRQGIPVYRLPRDVLDREIEAILKLGVDVRLGMGLNRGRTLRSLFDAGAQAAFLASGAGRSRGLEVEGSGLDGVVRAIDFLINVNNGFRVDMGRRVVVVGGGNVAMDVARTARLGRRPEDLTHTRAGDAAKDAFGTALPGQALLKAMLGDQRIVHVVARQPMGQWPAQRTVRGGEEVEEAKQEGIVFHSLRGLRRITGKDGRVAGVELAEVVQVYDEQGNYAPLYGSHAAEEIPCDTVFLAVGQEPELDYLEGTPDVKRTRRGLIEVDAETLATSMPGVYAGGDAAFGPRTLIEAVAEGKKAARQIHAFLSGGRRPDVRYRFEEFHPRGVPTADGFDRKERQGPPCQSVDRRTGIGEVDGSFGEEEAVEQAERCLVCHVQTVYDGDLCIACGRCTDVCPYACLSFVSPGAVESRGLDEAWLDAAPSEEGAVLMIKDEDRCIRCGLCADRCPTGAMTMERFDTTVEGVAS